MRRAFWTYKAPAAVVSCWISELHIEDLASDLQELCTGVVDADGQGGIFEKAQESEIGAIEQKDAV